MALTSLNVYTTSHPLCQTSLRFAPLATRPNFGSRDFIGSLRGQAEITLCWMSSDPHNGVYSLDLILMRLSFMFEPAHEIMVLIT